MRMNENWCLECLVRHRFLERNVALNYFLKLSDKISLIKAIEEAQKTPSRKMNVERERTIQGGHG